MSLLNDTQAQSLSTVREKRREGRAKGGEKNQTATGALLSGVPAVDEF